MFDNGICPACRYFETLDQTDWEERHRTLLGLVARFRSERTSPFDCILGVSGGKDSLRQALYLRDKLGANPLLACLSYPPEQLTERGARNISNLINHGFDVVISAPAPQVWRSLMRHSFDQYVNYARSTELALFASVPRIAIAYGIRLIMWGENPGLQLGDLGTLGKTGYDGNNLRNMNTLAGGDSEWLEACIPDVGKLIPYKYPTSEEFDHHQLQIVYLGWFLRDWSLRSNAAYSVVNGLDVREEPVSETGDLLGVASLDEDWVTLNQMIKYFKFGFGRATDYANEAIRNGELSRDDAIPLVAEFDGKCSDDYIASFASYIGISPDEFWRRVLGVVNRELFEVHRRSISPKFRVGDGL